MLTLYMMRMSSISGGHDDDEGYGVFSGPAVDASVTIVTFGVLAASVVIWEACAFAAMAFLVVSAIWWCFCFVTRRTSRRRRAVEASAAASVEDGLTDKAIDEALPASPYRGDGDPSAAAGGATCSVCLEEVRCGEMVRSLPECRHLFHAGCIDAWLRLHATCPLCRSDLSPRRRVTAPALPSHYRPTLV